MSAAPLAIALGWLSSAAWAAALSPRLFDEAGIGAAILLTLFGTLLHLYLPRQQMEAEEHIKDRRLTPEEARRRARFLRRCAITMTLVGVAVLCLVLLDLAQ